MIFPKLQHRIRHAAAHHTKIPRAVYKFGVRNAVDDAIKRARKRAANPRLSLSRDAAGCDAVAILLAETPEHLPNHLRRILQITVHHADKIAFGIPEPRIHRGFFAKVT
ncbi:hypothetical protein SDC9_149110 [bioreactor metagenome]|uniref:Uncharacterized protein n=1 Tax=bioreactor metagenome TaxID=1076179 RepID=A0A645EJF9_9ZZZZ